MTTISIPSSVADILRKATVPAKLIDEQGNLLGSFSPIRRSPEDELTPEELAEIKRRMKSPGPRHTTQQVLDYLDSWENK